MAEAFSIWPTLNPVFFPSQVPWSHGLLAPAQSDNTLCSPLALSGRPRAPLEHRASLERGSGRNCFSTLWHGFACLKRKVIFIPQEGIKHWWLFLKKGFSKLSHIGKKQHFPSLTQAGSVLHAVAHRVLMTVTTAPLRHVRQPASLVLVTWAVSKSTRMLT